MRRRSACVVRVRFQLEQICAVTDSVLEQQRSVCLTSIIFCYSLMQTVYIITAKLLTKHHYPSTTEQETRLLLVGCFQLLPSSL